MGSIDPTDTLFDHSEAAPQIQRPRDRLAELFAENITAKILRTATIHLEDNNPPIRYPEIVPQDGPNYGNYESRTIDFWTCGFFPGCIYSLLERLDKYPKSMASSSGDGQHLSILRRQLEQLGQTWSNPIHGESRLTNTHDMGFIMMPHMRPRWELYHDEDALNSIITSAKNLATRFSPIVRAIRSWDEDIWALVTEGRGKPGNYIVIMDSMCNLDLLFYAAAQTGLKYLRDVATTHARTVLGSHLRPEPKLRGKGYQGMLYSTGHVVNFSPKTGEVQEKVTGQGYSATSTWSRGQAWAILGYTQTYVWTGHREFLDAACGLAEYFLLKMETAPVCVEVELPRSGEGKSQRRAGRYVPVWDFAAPIEGSEPPLRDTSAGTCAANGMLILSQALTGLGKHQLAQRYLEGALNIVEDTLTYSLAEEKAVLKVEPSGQLAGINAVPGKTFEAILKNATVSNNPAMSKQIRDHGLVYGDYYLIEFGNLLLRMSLA